MATAIDHQGSWTIKVSVVIDVSASLVFVDNIYILNSNTLDQRRWL